MSARVVDCPDCTQPNRLPAALPRGKVARCGRCKFVLMAHDEDEDEDDEDDDEDVTPSTRSRPARCGTR